MKPYYEKSNIQIYCGDSREVLPNLNLHDWVLITDPVWPNCQENLLSGSSDPYALFSSFWESLSILPLRSVIVLRSDSDPRFLSAIPNTLPFFRCQILPYAVPGYIGRKLGGDEIAYCFGHPIPAAKGQHLIPGWAPKAQPSDRPPNGHPCSRALAHFIWLCRWWAMPGEIIVDGFCGSGTTLRAAMRHGNPAIGVEIEEKYCEIAALQIEQDSKQPDLFA